MRVDPQHCSYLSHLEQAGTSGVLSLAMDSKVTPALQSQ